MAKIKVSELAVQLDKSSSDIIALLQSKGVEATEDTQLEENQTAAVKRAMTPKKEGEGIKKRASVVFRPQNSAQNRGKGQSRGGQQSSGQRRPAGQSSQGRTVGQRTGVRTVSTVRPVQKSEDKAAAVKTVSPAAKEEKVLEKSVTEAAEAVIAAKEESSAVKATAAKSAAEAKPAVERPQKAKAAAPEKSQEEKLQGEKLSGEKIPDEKIQNEKLPSKKTQSEKSQSEKSQIEKPQSEKAQSDRPQGERRQGDRVQGERRQGDRPQGERRQGDRAQGERRQGDRPQGERRQGDRPQGERRQGDRPQGERRQSDRPQGERRQGDRPQGERRQGDRPQGNRPGDRTQGNRPGDRNQNNRRPQGDRRSAAPSMLKQDTFGKPGQSQNGKGNKKQESKGRDKFDKKEKEGFLSKLDKIGAKKGQKSAPAAKQAPAEKEIKTLVLPDSLTIKELAEKMKLQPSAIVKKLFMQGKVVTINQEVDYETAENIAVEFDFLCEQEEKVDVIGELLKDIEENEEEMVSRPPVVCVMGHVDHGKTSLLDAIRETNVIAREAGGITQHIGAYVVEINGQRITFLDTPGHEAFTAMRMRGAQSTDIAILVVAADDGVMPQTVEAINHAKAAGVEIIVAINKIDKPSANIERVKQELSEYELIPEDWGGSTIFVPVSAHTKEGIESLLEMILLVAEVKELKANPNRNARGLVIEAELDKGKGPVATVLVQKGTRHVDDFMPSGSCFAKVRAMTDVRGRRVKEATPSTPVEILGLNDVPNAGEVFVSTDTEKESRNFAETFIKVGREKLLEDTKAKLSLDDLFSQIKAGNVKELGLIIKADVQGSVEAVKQSLVKLSNDEVVVKIIHGGVGAINESDVTLASASNAIIIGFNVRPDATAHSIAEREKVDLRLYKVIYQAIADVEAAMKGMLDPIFEEKVVGHAIVRQLFKASDVGTIAGSYVTDGKFLRGCHCRISREGEQIYDGMLASLKRFKDDVKEVAAGYECGLVFEKFNDLKEDDTIEAYIMVEVPR